uniref:T-cell immunomodulatory protein n=1 Tax=Diabrotica virgifera virgifera TaxID=50390 RepID=A0A6P7F4V3_DIAVI
MSHLKKFTMGTIKNVIVVFLTVQIFIVRCSDITKLAFGQFTHGLPAAFGDFNSDELTDVFVLTNREQTLQILLAYAEEPLLRPAPTLNCTFKNHKITSVVPGDFDGDALMDVLITTIKADTSINNARTSIYILWGGNTTFNCTEIEGSPLIEMLGQPLAIDYNQDMIIDLFGEDIEEKRAFWVFGKNRTEPKKVEMHHHNKEPNGVLMKPHAHAFLDLNDDYMADLFITTKDNFEIWLGREESNPKKPKFSYKSTIPHPINPKTSETAKVIGQSLFVDVELKGKVDLLTPVCYDWKCQNGALLLYSNTEEKWIDLQVNFKDDYQSVWTFFKNENYKYNDVITLRSGDFNMDGYPDILATLTPVSNYNAPQSFLLENVPCQNYCGSLKRTFEVRWSSLNPFKNGTIMAAFFDFYQDGILDCIVVQSVNGEYKTAAFKNSLDYDANFIKVMVLTGLTNKNNPMMMGRVGKKRRTYGTNLPGPSISYKTTTQEGNIRHGLSCQLPQSAHFSLSLPYTIFGLGRTPNFVDKVTVGLSNYSKDWTQIIPNSQMVVIPWPTTEPYKWKAQLFVTPSKLILMSVAALTTVCGLITVIIGVLHWKERQEDKKERLSESHRFHFDAM